MLRRALSVAVIAAAAFLAVPAGAEAASAAAPALPPTNYSADTTVTLPDGRQATVDLWAAHGPGTPWIGQIGVSVKRPSGCGYPAPPCQSSGFGQAVLGARQVDLDPKLARAWSARVRVTLQFWTTDPQTGAMTSSTETVTVGTNFIGKGKTTWTSEKSNQCPIDGSPNCQTFELDGNRNAAASIRFGTKTLSGPGHVNSVSW